MLYSALCFQDVITKTVELIVEQNGKDCMVFCEDKLTLAIERALADKTGGTFSCEVTTFNRFYANRAAKQVLSKTSSCLIVRKILEDNKDKLRCFGKTGISLAKGLFELISQLKSAKITPKRLNECNGKFDGLFANKLADVSLVYSEYERVLQEKGLYDPNLKYSLLPEVIEKSDISDKAVICVGFSSLTKQSADIFKTLKNKAKSFDFVCIGGQGAFYLNEIRDFIISLGEKCVPVDYDEVKLRLSDALYKEGEKSGKQTDKIFFSEFYDEYDELCKIAESG